MVDAWTDWRKRLDSLSAPGVGEGVERGRSMRLLHMRLQEPKRLVQAA